MLAQHGGGQRLVRRAAGRDKVGLALRAGRIGIDFRAEQIIALTEGNGDALVRIDAEERFAALRIDRRNGSRQENAAVVRIADRSVVALGSCRDAGAGAGNRHRAVAADDCAADLGSRIYCAAGNDHAVPAEQGRFRRGQPHLSAL